MNFIFGRPIPLKIIYAHSTNSVGRHMLSVILEKIGFQWVELLSTTAETETRAINKMQQMPLIKYEGENKDYLFVQPKCIKEEKHLNYD